MSTQSRGWDNQQSQDSRERRGNREQYAGRPMHSPGDSMEYNQYQSSYSQEWPERNEQKDYNQQWRPFDTQDRFSSNYPKLSRTQNEPYDPEFTERYGQRRQPSGNRSQGHQGAYYPSNEWRSEDRYPGGMSAYDSEQRYSPYDNSRGDYGNQGRYQQGGQSYGYGQGWNDQGYTQGYGQNYPQDYNAQRGAFSGQSYGNSYGNEPYSSTMGTTYGNRNTGATGYANREYNTGRQRNDYGNYGRSYRDANWNAPQQQWGGYQPWESNTGTATAGNPSVGNRSWGSQEQGQHTLNRGKGPKGYTRSDERITEDINDKLSDDSYLDASEIEVKVKDGEVVLSGIIDTRANKRYAEDLVEEVSGVKNVENRLRLKDNGEQNESSATDKNSSRTGASSLSGSTGTSATSDNKTGSSKTKGMENA